MVDVFQSRNQGDATRNYLHIATKSRRVAGDGVCYRVRMGQHEMDLNVRQYRITIIFAIIAIDR